MLNGDFLSTFVLFLFLFFVLLFLASTLYWFNRMRRVPSLKLVWKTMVISLRTFPAIMAHRVRIVPARVRHHLNEKKHPRPSPYPVSKVEKKKDSAKRRK